MDLTMPIMNGYEATEQIRIMVLYIKLFLCDFRRKII